MKTIYKSRAGGKTRDAVKIAVAYDAYLVVDNDKQASLLHQEFHEHGLRMPVSFSEFASTKMQGSWIKKVVIDNADALLRQLFPGLDILAITITDPQDRLTIWGDDTYRRYSDKEMIDRVLRNLKSRDGQKPMWSVVSDHFAMGSTFSRALCIEFGYDPDKMIDPVECEYCAEARS